MIMLDLDGTLLCSDKSISDYTISVLERCKQKDIKIAIATARSEMASKRYIDTVKPDIVISNGGSLVRHGENTIHTCMLSAKTSDDITAQLMRKEEFVSIGLETKTGYYVSWTDALTPDYAHAIYYDFSVPLSEDTYKIAVELSHTRTNSGSNAAIDVAKNHPDCCLISYTGENFYRLAHVNSGKMSAIKEVAKYFNTDLSQIASFGDDYNDIEMIRDCGIGVAMGNAIDEVKTVANYVCDINDNDGIAKWLDSYV